MRAALAAAAAAWLRNPWLLWGVGPILASDAGFFATALLFELLLRSGLLDGRLIVYASGGDAPRKALMAKTHARVPFRSQVAGSTWHLLGWPSVANGVSLALLMQWARPAGSVTAWLPDTWWRAGLEFLALAALGDLGLYWGHRVQHEIPVLWRYHQLHHSIDTPSPWSTLFIHKTDAALQGSIPFALAALAVCPCPAVLYAYLFLRIAENALNHSGLDSGLVDALTLKSLPLRARISFHDAHHKYSNYAGNAKNYGETFIVWDWLFGTMGGLAGRAAEAAADERSAGEAKAR